MKTLMIIGLLALLTFLAIEGTYAGCTWDCTGTSDCSAAQADDCRSHLNTILNRWVCLGECVKAPNSEDTVATCETPAGFWDTCEYDGGSACSGLIERADCITIAMPGYDNGEYCSGECGTEWTTKYDPGVINNCT